MNWSEESILLVTACAVPMVIGGLSGSPSKAALGAAVLMPLVVFVAYAGLGHLEYLPTVGESFEETMILGLAVIPGVMVLGVIGYGVRCAFRRLLTRKRTSLAEV